MAALLMALMPSSRCPGSAVQVRTHLATPLSRGTLRPGAHFTFSPGANYRTKTRLGASERNLSQMLTSNIFELQIPFEFGSWREYKLLCAHVEGFRVYLCYFWQCSRLAVLFETGWKEMLGFYSLHTCRSLQEFRKGTDHFTSIPRRRSGGLLQYE